MVFFALSLVCKETPVASLLWWAVSCGLEIAQFLENRAYPL